LGSRAYLELCGLLRYIRSLKKLGEIAREHFEERFLKGHGNLMAENEMISHCELLIKSKDVVTSDSDKYAATGSTNFEENIEIL
jgi:hypothetical protein